MGFQDQCSEISWVWPLKNFVVFPGESLWDATCIYIHQSIIYASAFYVGVIGLNMDIRISKVPQVDWSATVDVSGVYQKITTNYFVIFVDWFWRLELDLLKNHYKHLRVFFQGILKGLLLDSLVFVVTLYPGWGCTFVVIFFGLCMENVVIGVGQSYFTATKSWPNSPPQIPTPMVYLLIAWWCSPCECHNQMDGKWSPEEKSSGESSRQNTVGMTPPIFTAELPSGKLT